MAVQVKTKWLILLLINVKKHSFTPVTHAATVRSGGRPLEPVYDLFVDCADPANGQMLGERRRP